MPEAVLPAGNIPQPQKKQVKLERFRGIDLTSGVVNVDLSRSPDAPNIMPDEDGFPKKRPGWKVVRRFEGAVHGAWRYVKDGAAVMVVHAGTKLFAGEDDEPVYESMADAASVAVQLGGKLWILDGATYLVYDGETCQPVSETATVPMVTISKAPNGETGATSYQPINMLTGWRTDSYLGTAGDKVYYLSFGDLSEADVKIQTLDAEGVWQDVTSGYTVDRQVGSVSFETAPGESPVTGEDNVHITYETLNSEAGRINKNRYMILYGVRGALDRVFMAGNPDEMNVDYWSEWNDPAYIGDVFYGMLGQDASPIVGYSVLNNRLVAHKQGEENGRNVFVRSGGLDDEGFATFEITDVLQGEGAIAPRSFGSISGEPVYLTKRGVYALTTGDVTGERYAQMRSYYLNGGLLREGELAGACGTVWGRFYVLAINGKLYLLDAEQKAYENREPYSAHQYEGYLWTGVPAVFIFEYEGELWFGTGDGRLCRFNSGNATNAYNDDGQPIVCRWTTPLTELDIWGKVKTVTGVWVVGQPYTRSSGKIYYATDKEYEKQVRDYTVDIFDWNDVDFNRFTFNLLDRPTIVATGRKAKKVKLFQVKVENDALNEPFGIIAMQIDYRVGGRIRR